MTPSNPGHVQYMNPEMLPKNPAFTNVVVVTGHVKTVYIGGQDAVDSSGALVGKGNLVQQTEQVLHNLHVALQAGGAELEHVVKWNVYLVQGHAMQPAFEVFQRVWNRRPNPPAVTVMFVAGLARPDFLVEMDAIAVVPE